MSPVPGAGGRWSSAGGALRQAFGFLTVLPGSGTPGPSARAAFPVVGAVVGAAVGATWWGASRWWSPLVAGVLAVAVDAVLTGILHLDGLADSADGLLAPMDRARRLAVMASPDVGAFAVVVVVLVVGVEVAALATIELGGHDGRAVAALAALWASSRAVLAVVPGLVPYARANGGLATSILGGTTWAGAAVGAVVVATLVAVSGAPGRVAIAVAVVVLAAAAVVGWGWRRLGGFTGDVLGAACVVGQAAGLLALAARP